jgi:hypothetical protein
LQSTSNASVLRNKLGASALIAGFAAAQISFLPVGKGRQESPTCHWIDLSNATRVSHLPVSRHRHTCIPPHAISFHKFLPHSRTPTNLRHAGPSLASSAPSAPQPSIDYIADDATAGDVLAEVSDAEIPQLEAELGSLSRRGASPEAVSAAADELASIEAEVAQLDEKEGAGADGLAAGTSGVLSQITSLKAIMRGMKG